MLPASHRGSPSRRPGPRSPSASSSASRPAAPPKGVIDRLNGEINRILATKPVVERIGALGGATTPMTPNQFDAKARDDFQRFGVIIRERKIVGD